MIRRTVLVAAPLVAAGLLAAGLLAAVASAQLLAPQMHTVAGGGSCAPTLFTCNNVSATSTLIGDASSVAALPGGGFLFVDSLYDVVREVSPSGVVTTVAGNGTRCDVDSTATNGVTATSSGLNGPVAVSPLPDGSFLITEYSGSVIRMVSPGPPGVATITTIAGAPGMCVTDPLTGIVTVLANPGGKGDLSGPAQGPGAVPLNYPSDAVPTADGGVLIADTGSGYVRKLSDTSPAATVSTIAGGGSCNDTTAACEGQAAGNVLLHDPVSVSPLQDGSGGYLVAENDNAGANAIREVSAMSLTGTFTTVAGVLGQPNGYNGDGGLATSALLSQPEGVLSTADGGFLIADTGNERIREVSPSGTITTIAGDGTASYAGDGGDATAASFDAPAGLSFLSSGQLVIADANDGAIREITTAPVSTIKLTPSAPNGGGYYNTSVKVTISAPGGKSTTCVLDPSSAPPVYAAMPSSCPYKGSGASVSADGPHTIYAASANSFGDQELPVSVSFVIDATAPVVTCLSKKPKFTFGEKGAVIRALVTDQGSGPVDPLISATPDTSKLGSQWLIATGYDVAGNVGGQVCYYTVVPAKLTPTPSLARAFAPRGGYTAVKRLAVADVPTGASVSVLCHGRSCPFAAKRNLHAPRCRGRHCRPGSGTVYLRALFAKGHLAAGTRLTITVTKTGTTGRAFLLGLRAGQAPSYRASCLAPGSPKPGQGCS